MRPLKSFLLSKSLEVLIFSIGVSIYYALIYPSDNYNFATDLYFAFAMVVTFFVVSLYLLLSLAVHLMFLAKDFFPAYSVIAYIASVALFVSLNPIAGVENILIFLLAIPFVYIVAKLAKRLTS